MRVGGGETTVPAAPLNARPICPRGGKGNANPSARGGDGHYGGYGGFQLFPCSLVLPRRRLLSGEHLSSSPPPEKKLFLRPARQPEADAR